MIRNYTMSVVEFVWVAWQDLVFLKSCLPLEVFQSEWCSVSFLSLPVQVPFHHSSLCMRFCWNSFFLFFRNQQLCFVFFKLSYTRATFEVRKLHLQGWWHVQCKFYWMWNGGRINSKTCENTNIKKTLTGHTYDQFVTHRGTPSFLLLTTVRNKTNNSAEMY